MRNSEDINKELQREFDSSLEMPESLSKNNMVKMLKEKNIKQDKKTRVKILPRVMSAAAMLVIVAVAAVSIGLRSEFVEVEPVSSAMAGTTQVTESAQEPVGETVTENAVQNETQGESTPVNSLKVAKSEADLQNHFLKLYAEKKLDNYVDVVGDFVYKMADDVVLYAADGAESDIVADSRESFNASVNMAPTMAPAATQSVMGSELKAHGTTNVQVADVDEGDIIKNDGKYLYIVNSYTSSDSYTKSRLTIVNTETMTEVYEGSVQNEKQNNYMRIQDIYVSGDILTAVCTYDRRTYAVIYDITERHNPKEIRRVDQDGTYISSRMVDGILYTVTNYSVTGSSVDEIKENAIPVVNCDCIEYSKCYVVDEDSTGYIVLSAFDTKDTQSDVSSISVLGGGFDIYSTSSTLYVYSSNYEYSKADDYGVVYTDIYSFSIDGTNITHKASGKVKGECINQYSLDEYSGYLRVATTYYDYRKNIDVSSVYVLDSSLTKVGEVFDLAKDEQVKAVRFMGKTGYVVTFRNTDPLFIIDFSDPTKPTVTGELKIPGYSTYIHPLDENYLVGIGYDGTEENADTNTVKVSVFDVRDKTNPKETDTFVIKDAYSLVNENPKAFFLYAERNIIGIPVSHYDNNGNTVKSIQTVTIKDGKISDHLGYIHYAGSSENYYGYYWHEEIFRGTYIDNLLYTIDNYEVMEHNLDSGEKTRTCVIGSRELKDNNTATTADPGVITETTTVVVY